MLDDDGMGSDRNRLPAGRQPYDTINGLRIGALAGGLLGALIAAATHLPWLLLAGAVIGGATGYWSERRKARRTRDERHESDS